MKKLIALFGLVLCANTNVFAQYSTTPIILSLPMDGDTIEEDEPLFVWQTTLSNAENDPRLNLKLNVVQVGEDQSATEAMLENAPVFTRQNLLSTSINYAEIDHELVEGKWYAWQVILLYNGVQVQQSEVFKFIKAQPVIRLDGFTPLRITNDASILVLENDRLNVSTKAAGDFQTKCTITDANGKKYQVNMEQLVSGEFQKTEVSKMTTDTRYFSVNVKELKLKKGIYSFEWNINQTSYTLNFMLK